MEVPLECEESRIVDGGGGGGGGGGDGGLTGEGGLTMDWDTERSS